MSPPHQNPSPPTSGQPCASAASACPGGGSGSFPSRDAAARAALDAANPVSIRDNREYGGQIYRNPDGTYGYTGPGTGSGTAFDLSSTPVPPGTTPMGDYHTHGDYSTADAAGNPVRTGDPARDDFNSDQFSSSDRRGIAADGRGNPDYRGYLGTPGGSYRVYDPATGTDSVF